MGEKLLHFVTFYYPGAFFSEKSVRQLNAHDPIEAAQMAEPSGYLGTPFGFTLHDIVETTSAYDKSLLLRSEPINESKFYFINSERLDAAQIAFTHGTDSVLYKSMTNNKWKYIVKCPPGNHQPLTNGDFMINNVNGEWIIWEYNESD